MSFAPANDNDPWEDLGVLRALVQELRSRLSNHPLTMRQIDDIGTWLYKGYCLGRGEAPGEVLRVDFVPGTESLV